MNTFYPIKFQPILKDKIWGGSRLKNILNKATGSDKCGESWEISAVQGNLSIVKNGYLTGNNLQEIIEVYMGDLVGDKIYSLYGIEFPLLIKFIDANDILSVQVHPDDELAKMRHNAYGKTEMWYVVEAEKDAELISGFNRELDRETYLRHLQSKTLKEILNYEKVRKGDVFFTPAGRVHAVGAGILLAEIQQTSDITYRIYDWDRLDDKGYPREMHTELALDALDFKYYDKYRTDYEAVMNLTTIIADCKYFTTGLLLFDQPVEKDYNFIDSFVIYMCLEGRINIFYGNNMSEEITKGESVLIPASLKNITLVPAGQAKTLEVYVK
ncbi:MAG: mannose-6-phosphate isomerase [Bacteroides sp. SM23_62_1]|nr:MAG: mannose-6-phosphate isomerase [Bacteroides sp. SM23_62_1]